nr:PREDICTED: deleted in malignant brain tumors 1 protein-like [Latimeria chalumnae]|eukprot:XP_014349420.1 PREDICTED: deleted in malignant brain tumors 1 protein-like [Latimeria chalumnae]
MASKACMYSNISQWWEEVKVEVWCFLQHNGVMRQKQLQTEHCKAQRKLAKLFDLAFKGEEIDPEELGALRKELQNLVVAKEQALLFTQTLLSTKGGHALNYELLRKQKGRKDILQVQTRDGLVTGNDVPKAISAYFEEFFSEKDTSTAQITDFLKDYKPPGLVNMPLRFADGDKPCSGRVEILHNGRWGSVCDGLWDLQDADVVCKELGCRMAISAPGRAHFGEGSGEIWKDDVECDGSKSRLVECPSRPWGQHDCTHRDDAGVVCSGKGSAVNASGMVTVNSSVEEHESKPVEFQLRLINGESLCSGRLEVYHKGSWGRVFDDFWDLSDGQVACRQLRCGNVIAVYTGSRYGKGKGPVWLNRVECQGDEDVLWNCNSSKLNQPQNLRKDAALICSEHRSLRLVSTEGPCTGKIDVFSDGSWGSVCHDSQNVTTANVVCRQLGCGEAMETEYLPRKSGSVWLDEAKCLGNESSLWECSLERRRERDCASGGVAGVFCSEHKKLRLTTDDVTLHDVISVQCTGSQKSPTKGK